jgi:hypothetical protein
MVPPSMSHLNMSSPLLDILYSLDPFQIIAHFFLYYYCLSWIISQNNSNNLLYCKRYPSTRAISIESLIWDDVIG